MYNVIKINWLTAEGFNKFFNCNRTNFDGWSLVQIYGDSPKYGKNALLYIGTATKSILSKLRSKKENISNLYFIMGHIPQGLGGTLQRDIHNLYISIGIFQAVIKPPYNKFNVKLFSKDLIKKRYLILNRMQRGMLPLDISNFWLTDEVGFDKDDDIPCCVTYLEETSEDKKS